MRIADRVRCTLIGVCVGCCIAMVVTDSGIVVPVTMILAGFCIMLTALGLLRAVLEEEKKENSCSLKNKYQQTR